MNGALPITYHHILMMQFHQPDGAVGLLQQRSSGLPFREDYPGDSVGWL